MSKHCDNCGGRFVKKSSVKTQTSAEFTYECEDCRSIKILEAPMKRNIKHSKKKDLLELEDIGFTDNEELNFD